MRVGEALTGGVVVGLGGISVVGTSWRVAARLIGHDMLDRSLAALVLALGELCVVLQLLGIAGLLNRWATLIVLVAIAAVVLARFPAAHQHTSEPARRAPACRDGRLEWLAAIALCAGVGGLALVLGLQGFSHSPDTLQYHTPTAGTWLHAGSLLHLPIAVPGYVTNAYPSDHTLTALWLMLSTGSDQLAYVVNVAWGVLAVLGAAALTRTLGGRASAGALLALGVVVAPVTFATQTNSMLSDLAAAGGVVAGAAAAVRATSSSRATQWALIAGVAVGLGAGSKYTAFIPAGAVVGVPFLVLGRRAARLTTVLVAAATPLVAFWLIRNAAEFGNPLFPQHLGPLAGYSSPLSALDTNMARHLLDANTMIVGRWFDLTSDLVGFAMLLPVAAAVAGAIALRRHHRRRTATAVVALVSFAAYLVTPFTGGGPAGLAFLIGSNLRYSLPALFVAVPIAAAAAGRRAWVLAAPLIVFGAIKIADGVTFRDDLSITAPRGVAALVIATGVAALAMRPGPLRSSRRATSVTTAFAALALAGATALVLHEQEARPPTITERLLAQRCPGGTVGVLQVRDLRSLMGRKFEVPVEAIDKPAPAGRQPILDPRALDRRIAELAPALVVETPGPIQPSGWRGPPGWRRVGNIGAATVLAPSKERDCKRS